MGSSELDRGRLRASAGVGTLWRSVEVVEQTGSTNADLAAAARAGAPGGTVLVTGHQSNGRGRLDRTWVAPPGAGLALSVLVRPPVELVARWTWLPLITGVAVTDALRSTSGVEAVLKWPNDVLIGGGKVGGILAERVESPAGLGSPEERPACVIGVGINVELSERQLPVPGATSLRIAGATDRDRTAIVAAVLGEFERRFTQWQDRADDVLARAYRERCTTLGRIVRVDLGADRRVTGRAEAIDPDGRLVVATDRGRRAFSAGDVVHLR